MNRPDHRRKKEEPNKEPSRLDELICIDTYQGALVYEYYNGILNDVATHQFEDHLLLCFRCQDIVLKLDLILDLMKADIETTRNLRQSDQGPNAR